MKPLIYVILTCALIACGESGGPQTAMASDAPAGEIDFCTCVNEPMDTDARLKTCTKLIEAMSPGESTKRTMECRAALPMPEGGPDLCYCLRVITTDPEVANACKALIDEDMTPRELVEKSTECAKK